MPCLAHMLNTAMKECKTSLEQDQFLSILWKDFKCVKCTVQDSKKSGWNSRLLHGLADRAEVSSSIAVVRLIQYVETRFGTTHSVVARLLKASMAMHALLTEDSRTASSDALESLRSETDRGGSVIGYPALEAIIDAFEVLVEARTRLQASKTPTIHLALPLMQDCSDKLLRIANGGKVWQGAHRGRIVPSRYSCGICSLMTVHVGNERTFGAVGSVVNSVTGLPKKAALTWFIYTIGEEKSRNLNYQRGCKKRTIKPNKRGCVNANMDGD